MNFTFGAGERELLALRLGLAEDATDDEMRLAIARWLMLGYGPPAPVQDSSSYPVTMEQAAIRRVFGGEGRGFVMASMGPGRAVDFSKLDHLPRDERLRIKNAVIAEAAREAAEQRPSVHVPDYPPQWLNPVGVQPGRITYGGRVVIEP